MAFDLRRINERAERDPEEFAQECEERYNQRVTAAAKEIAQRRRKNPIVLLSGPSGSGKTTTAKKICGELEKIGVYAHTVSLDNYFKTLTEENAPLTNEGEIDRESPLCLDLDLLNHHFHKVEQGVEIEVPRFDFKRQKRHETVVTPMRVQQDEIVIFEGIHALNDIITREHPESFKLYISARSSVLASEEELFKGTWMRLMRRVVRDEFFRGTGAQSTLSMWANVRRGEKTNISPFKNKADFIFDSSLPYEVPVLKRYAALAFSKIPDGTERFSELKSILPALTQFTDIKPDYVPPDSILREFIGGGIYKY